MFLFFQRMGKIKIVLNLEFHHFIQYNKDRFKLFFFDLPDTKIFMWGGN